MLPAVPTEIHVTLDLPVVKTYSEGLNHLNITQEGDFRFLPIHCTTKLDNWKSSFTVIDNYIHEVIVSQHAMVTFRGMTNDWLSVLAEIRYQIRQAGLKELRAKVELSVVGMPLNYEPPKGCYFESHMRLNEQPFFLTIDTFASHSLKWPDRYYLTVRRRDVNLRQFIIKVLSFMEYFTDEKATLPEMEFCTYDSNPQLDESWMGLFYKGEL